MEIFWLNQQEIMYSKCCCSCMYKNHCGPTFKNSQSPMKGNRHSPVYTCLSSSKFVVAKPESCKPSAVVLYVYCLVYLSLHVVAYMSCAVRILNFIQWCTDMWIGGQVYRDVELLNACCMLTKYTLITETDCVFLKYQSIFIFIPKWQSQIEVLFRKSKIHT